MKFRSVSSRETIVVPVRPPTIVEHLPRPAAACYELLCDVERWVEWMPFVKSVRVLTASAHERVVDAQLTIVASGQMFGCRVQFAYAQRSLAMTWASHPASLFQFAGTVAFAALDRTRSEIQCDLAAGAANASVPAPLDIVRLFESFTIEHIGGLELAEGSAPRDMPTGPIFLADGTSASREDDRELEDTIARWLMS